MRQRKREKYHARLDRHMDGLDAASGAPLHAHQREGVHWMEDKKRGVLADEPGLGKTRMVLAWMSFEARKVPGRRILLVTPAALREQWLDENASHAKIRMHMHTRADPIGPEGHVTICTYGHLRINHGLRAHPWTTVVFDEAHVMSPDSQVLGIARDMSGHKFPITATPTTNTRADFAALLALVGHQAPPMGQGAAPDCVLRRRRDVLPALPELHVHARLLDPHESEAPLHAALLHNFMGVRPTNASEFAHARALGLCGSRRGSTLSTLGIQAAEGAAPAGRALRRRLNAHRWDVETAAEDYAEAVRYERGPGEDALPAAAVPVAAVAGGDRSAKRDAMEQDLRASLGTGRRILIFFRFQEQRAAILDLLEELGVRRRDVGVIEGSVSASFRTALLAAPPAVVLLQIKVGSAGLNLSMFSVVFLSCAGWTDAEIQQAIARVHRQGQVEDVHLFMYRLRNSMDTPQAIARKRKRALAAYDGLDMSGGICL